MDVDAGKTSNASGNDGGLTGFVFRLASPFNSDAEVNRPQWANANATVTSTVLAGSLPNFDRVAAGLRAVMRC
jgi:hypothetical protein